MFSDGSCFGEVSAHRIVSKGQISIYNSVARDEEWPGV